MNEQPLDRTVAALANVAGPAGSLTDSFSVDGRDYVVRAIGGVVITTEQRSDTHVSGSGSVLVIDGTGGGRSQVSSHVQVIRDVWVRDHAGSERHIRIQGDVPVREGQIFFVVHLAGQAIQGAAFDCAIRYYNATIDESWEVTDFGPRLGAPSTITPFHWFAAAVWFVVCFSIMNAASKSAPMFAFIAFIVGLLPLAKFAVARSRGVPSLKGAIADREKLVAGCQDHARQLVARIRQALATPVRAA